jgi:antitoxin component of MazEF toxin-antitoxin module
MSRVRKVIKTGNSLAITIPSKIIVDFSLKEGDLAQVKVNRTKTSLTYVFTGHPRQLSLMTKQNNVKK